MITARELSLSPGLANPSFNHEDAARAYFEATRWPENKPVCPDRGINPASPGP
ncbi:MAG TPA: hypothetical protein VIH87_14900 [Methylocella sp.]